MEIKFRAFSEKFNTWHYWDVYGEYPQGIYGGLSKPQQYTGINDKNGVDIYAGDILKVHRLIFPRKNYDKWYDKIENGVVRWFDSEARFLIEYGDDFEDIEDCYSNRYEVIGYE